MTLQQRHLSHMKITWCLISSSGRGLGWVDLDLGCPTTLPVQWIATVAA